jgi:sensor domain CHASE-containing protein
MKLVTKAIITVILIALAIFVSMQVITVTVIQPSFAQIEQDRIRTGITHAVNMVNYQISDLTTEVCDYAYWDDTYNFSQNQTQAYLDNNFVDSTFINLNLNLVIIINNGNDLLYCQSFDLTEEVKVQITEDAKTTLTTDALLWNFQSIDTISGVMLVDGKPLLVASAPILTSSGEGSAVGRLLFGTYLDSEAISELSAIIGLNFSLYPLSGLQESNSQIADSLLTQQQSSLSML